MKAVFTMIDAAYSITNIFGNTNDAKKKTHKTIKLLLIELESDNVEDDLIKVLLNEFEENLQDEIQEYREYVSGGIITPKAN